MILLDPYGFLHRRQNIDTVLSEAITLHRLNNREQRIGMVLRNVDLLPLLRFRFAHQLAGGQRQRMAIAQAPSSIPFG